MKKYITTHDELMKLNGRLVECKCQRDDGLKEIFLISVDEDEVLFIRKNLWKPNEFLLASSKENKIEKNKLRMFDEIEIVDNKDEEDEIRKKTINE